MAVTPVGPSTGFRGISTYDLTQQAAEGYVPATHVIRDLRKAAMALEPHDYPFQTTIGYGDPVSQMKHEWARKSFPVRRVSLAATLNIGTNPGNMTLSATDAKYIAKYMVLQIDTELFWVYDTPTGTTVPLVGAQGGTTPASHATGTNNVFVVGTAMPQLEDYALSPFVWGEQYFNYPQRFSGAVKTDRAADVTPNYELMGMQHDEKVRAELEEQHIHLEESIYRARRQLGSLVQGAMRPSMFGGIREFVGNIYDQSAGALTIYTFETVALDMNAKVSKNMPRQLIMSDNDWAIVSRLLNPRREWREDTAELNLVWRAVSFGVVTYRFMTSFWCPDGQIWGLNTKDLSILPYRSMGWHERELPNSGEAKYTGVGMDCTFEALGPKAMFLINNYDRTLANYPTL